MEPGVSSGDCLDADHGFVKVPEDHRFARFPSNAQSGQVLVDILARDYELSPEVIIYRAATLPLRDARILRLPLGRLPEAGFDRQVTLVTPPARPFGPDVMIRERLIALDAAELRC